MTTEVLAAFLKRIRSRFLWKPPGMLVPKLRIQDLAGGLLGEELPRAHVAVAIDHAPLGEGEAVQVAVAVEGVAVALPVDLEPAGPVAEQDAAQPRREGALDDRERDPRPRR
jgi:hypothetical protein